MKWNGGCLCGAVRYEASEAPQSAGYCHCGMCQRSSGSVVTASATFPKAAFHFTRGEPKFYKSSKIAERGFCANCGSRLVYRPFHADWIRVEMGSLDNPEDVPPTEHYGIESQVLWLTIDDGLPRKRTEDYPRFQELVTAAEKRRK